MTELSSTLPSHTTHFNKQLPLIGFAQGLLLWLLLEWIPKHFTVYMPGLYGVLMFLVITSPLMWYWTAQTEMPSKRRWLGVSVIALWITLLLFDLSTLFMWTKDDGGSEHSLKSMLGSDDTFTPTTLLSIVATHLLIGWHVAGSRNSASNVNNAMYSIATNPIKTSVKNGFLFKLLSNFDYERLFRLTWRNAVLTVVAAVLTGVFFGVLFAGAGLLKLLGIEAVWELLEKPWFAMPVGFAAYGAAFALGLARAQMIVTLRQFWLSINAWFLPLLLGFVVVWVIALPITGFAGLDLLLKTHRASALLLSVTALCVKFANCAYQDGHVAQPLGGRLSRLVQWLWPALLVVIAVAGWALWQRVAHRGWTGDRIWAVLVFTMVAIYSVGYSLSILTTWRASAGRKQLAGSEKASSLSILPVSWMPTIAPTNIVAACVLVVALSLLLTPWLHPNLLAMHSQLNRLASGSVSPENFDYRVLSNAGEEGELVLKALAAKTDAKTNSPRDVAIAQRAKLRMEGNDYEQYRGDRELDETDAPPHHRSRAACQSHRAAQRHGAGCGLGQANAGHF